MLEAGARFADAQYVYCIGEADGPVKIGLAKNPVKRLREMQIGNPRRLKVERLVFGDMSIERYLQQCWEGHAIYARGQVNGDAPRTEWFEADVRQVLYPVIASAVAAQLAAAEEEDFDFAVAERCLREAHGAHDVVAVAREHIRVARIGRRNHV